MDEASLPFSSQLPNDPREELSILEGEVARVSAVLSSLLSRGNTLKQHINMLYSPFLHRLPVEIISEIFTFCIPTFDPRSDAPSAAASCAPLILGAVCTAWRSIAWSTPILWATFTFRLTSPLKMHSQVSLLEEWLARSGQLPLSIKLTSSDDFSWTGVSSEGVIKAIRKYANRWRDLSIYLPSSCYRHLPASDEILCRFPLLESFTLKPPGGQGDRVHRINMPISQKLQYLSLSCLYLRSIVFHFEVLTHVELESFYIDEILEMLRQTTALVNLTAKRILSGDDRHDPPEDPVLLLNLEELCIVNDKGTDIQLLFDKICTPKLNILTYAAEGLQTVPAADIVSLVKRSQCSLETLSIRHAPIREESLQILLASLPSLIVLNMSMPTLTSIRHAPLTDAILRTLDPKYAQANKMSCTLPSLKHLSYAGAQGFTWDTFLRVLESRCPPLDAKDPSCSSVIPTLTLKSPSCIPDVCLTLSYMSPEEKSDFTPPCSTMLESLANRGVSIAIHTSVRPGLHALVEEA